MKLLNDKGTDLSREGYLNLALLMVMVYACELICFRLARHLDALRVRGSLVQARRREMHQARLHLDGLIGCLTHAFDSSLLRAMTQVNGEEAERTKHIQWLANDTIKMLIIYFVKGDGKPEVKDRMKAALMNFKSVEDEMDIKDLQSYYK